MKKENSFRREDEIIKKEGPPRGQKEVTKMEKEKDSIWKVSDKKGSQKTKKPFGIETFKWDKTRSAKLFDKFDEMLRPKKEDGKKVRLTGRAEELMEQFDEFAREGTVVTVRFDTCDTVGNYTSMTDEGVLFLLPSENFLRGGEFNKYAASKVFSMEFELQVVEVDRARRRIVLKRPEEGTKNAEGRPAESTRNVCIREFKKALEKGESPLIVGRVTEVYDEFAYVDVFDEGIAATVGRAKWRNGYVESLKRVVRPGEYCRFYVKDVKKNKDGKQLIYLSHKEFADDDWDKVDWTGIEVGGSILVECVDKPASKNYFWGLCDRIPGNSITCNYTEKFRKGSKNVMTGIRYDCKIVKIERGDENNKRCIVVTPYRVYEHDRMKLTSAQGIGDDAPVFDPFSSDKKTDEGVTETQGGDNE